MNDLPDMTDPDIREMVERNHGPWELWDDKKKPSEFMAVICTICHQEWPCPSIKAARAAAPLDDGRAGCRRSGTGGEPA